MQPSEYTEEYVIAEAKRLLYLYELKHIIRYAQTRDKDDYRESVAEHIYGLHILADYFLPLEDPEQKLDESKVRSMINWHDVTEIETGEIPAMKKTKADEAREFASLATLLTKIPSHLQVKAKTAIEEFEALQTPEAQFVKAIDKLEQVIHAFHPLGKEVHLAMGLTAASSRRVKEPYLHHHPHIRRFYELLHPVMEREGYFVS